MRLRDQLVSTTRPSRSYHSPNMSPTAPRAANSATSSSVVTPNVTAEPPAVAAPMPVRVTTAERARSSTSRTASSPLIASATDSLETSRGAGSVRSRCSTCGLRVRTSSMALSSPAVATNWTPSRDSSDSIESDLATESPQLTPTTAPGCR